MHAAKVSKLISRLKIFVALLESKRNLSTHQHVSQFYYMQRTSELTALFEQFEEAQRRLDIVDERLDLMYIQTFYQWREDFLWLHRCEKCNSD